MTEPLKNFFIDTFCFSLQPPDLHVRNTQISQSNNFFVSSEYSQFSVVIYLFMAYK